RSVEHGENMSKHDYLYRKRSKGHEYLYFRAPNGKLTPLPLDQKSAAFRVAYAAALRTIKPSAAEPQTRAAHEGSIEAAIRVYLASTAFAAIKPDTKENYRRNLDRMRDKIGAAALKSLDTDAVDIYSEQIAKAHGASVADVHVGLISMIWAECKKYPR